MIFHGDQTGSQIGQGEARVLAFESEVVRREDRGPSTAQLLAQSGEKPAEKKCACGGKCQTVAVACVDCKEEWSVPPSHVGTFEALHVRAGHAVTVRHTAPRTALAW